MKIRKKVKRTEHEYMRRMRRAIENGVIDQPMAAFAEIKHDDYCGIWKRKLCDCDPDITFDVVEGETFRLDAEGFLTKMAGD